MSSGLVLPPLELLELDAAFPEEVLEEELELEEPFESPEELFEELLDVGFLLIGIGSAPPLLHACKTTNEPHNNRGSNNFFKSFSSQALTNEYKATFTQFIKHAKIFTHKKN